MKAAVIVYPGSNCDRDVAVALEKACGAAPVMAWHGNADLPKVDLIVLPGGFSYGDYLRSGAMAARSAVMATVLERAKAGVPVLGICNGFQVLTETGLLPGALMRNAELKFFCRDIYLRVENTDSAFTHDYKKDQVLRVPIAHHDGSYFADDETLEALGSEDRVAFRYCRPTGEVETDANPNGSVNNIAGIFSKDRKILGMMPHPERVIEPLLGGDDGAAMFSGLVAALS